MKDFNRQGCSQSSFSGLSQSTNQFNWQIMPHLNFLKSFADITVRGTSLQKPLPTVTWSVHQSKYAWASVARFVATQPNTARTHWPFLYDTNAQRKPELPAGAESQTVQQCVVISIIYSTRWLFTCSANVRFRCTSVDTFDNAPLSLSALLIHTASNTLLAISGRTQFLRKPSNPQTIRAYHSNMGKITNEIFLPR